MDKKQAQIRGLSCFENNRMAKRGLKKLIVGLFEGFIIHLENHKLCWRLD